MVSCCCHIDLNSQDPLWAKTMPRALDWLAYMCMCVQAVSQPQVCRSYNEQATCEAQGLSRRSDACRNRVPCHTCSTALSHARAHMFKPRCCSCPTSLRLVTNQTCIIKYDRHLSLPRPSFNTRCLIWGANVTTASPPCLAN